jgi:hypothetical protein
MNKINTHKFFFQYHSSLHIPSLSHINPFFQELKHFGSRPLLFRHKSKETNHQKKDLQDLVSISVDIGAPIPS